MTKEQLLNLIKMFNIAEIENISIRFIDEDECEQSISYKIQNEEL